MARPAGGHYDEQGQRYRRSRRPSGGCAERRRTLEDQSQPREGYIRGHLSVLKEVGVVEELTIPPGERTRGYPYKFYRLTRRARDLFDENGLFPETAWKRQYDRLAKDAEMRELEQMPRPEPDRDASDDRGEELAAD
ncbi:hypothetical protein [Halomontanus rarus]|uniref:hypothetical protein n=1 Tax=Halomontanus rarus TaxID=3034020 RepID=UPI0023E7B19E|nr:hypothetical protein [Halovivax sp. TS33]